MQGKAIDSMEIYGMALVITALVANNVLPRIQRADRAAVASSR